MARARALRDVACGLRDEIDRTLSPLLDGVDACALLDFPNHPNVGDSAIWLGTCRWLAARGLRVVYASDARYFSAVALRRRLARGGLVLLNGGGNLGDLWPLSQAFRERVLGELPDYRVLQLPQTIGFRDPAAIGPVRAALGAHPDFTLLVRDRTSQELAERELELPAAACPDMAFALGPLARPRAPDEDVSFLIRTDAESALGAPPAGLAARCRDWLDHERSSVDRLHDELARSLRRRPRSPGAAFRLLSRLQDACARRRLRRGCALLARGEVVVCDRLHGHVLSVLLGIPHVCLPEAHGKLRAFHDLWTREAEGVVFADSWREALAAAESLRQRSAPAGSGA